MSSSTASSAQKEVDYYLNPTELFRWINYRRWDGAKSRAQSHPDECATWIVSRHNTDGRILWRHLPLHLICMQKEAACGVQDESDVQAVVASRQMEQLMDVLLDSYPEGASSPDDQGMLPLHLLLSKAEGEPNERVINLLLSSFPNAVDIRDKFGRTPNDILRESCSTPKGEGQAASATSDSCRAAARALKRARYVSDRITATIRDESANIVAAVQHEATNERGASQKIIVRLEEELSNYRKEMDARDARERNDQQDIRRKQGDLSSMEAKLNDVNKNLEVTRKERDKLLSTSDGMRSQLDNHNEIVERVRLDAENESAKDKELISNLKSEVSTCKAMSEALESQLRSRFTNEEYLSSTVADLEEQLEELKVRYEHTEKKHMHEVESLTADNKKLKWNSEELAKKNTQLSDKLKELNKQMSSIISSYSALNSEHDRLLELSQTYEASLLESIRSERSNLVEHYNKQREMLQKTFSEQERIIEASFQEQDKLVTTAKSDRTRGKGTVEKLRNEFQQLRAAAADRERMLHAEEMAANRKAKRNAGGEKNGRKHSPPRNGSESITSSQGESRNPHHSGRPIIHQAPSNSTSTADGHLVRLLDERAAAQSSTPRRGKHHQGLSFSTSAGDSSIQPQYYKQQQHHHHNHSSSGNKHRTHPPSPVTRGVPSTSLSMSKSNNSIYPSPRGGLPGATTEPEGYSLEQYSHDGTETSGRYSEGSGSSYSNEGLPPTRRVAGIGDPPPPTQYHQQYHHQAAPQQWAKYGRGMNYVEESFNDESTTE